MRKYSLVFLAAAAAAAFSSLPAGTASAQAVFDVRSGGANTEGRQQMMEVYDNYNLHLAFLDRSRRSGAPLADVDVTIRDPKGNTVWQGVSEGSYLFAKLPEGQYNVQASFEGKPQSRNIQVSAAGGSLHSVTW
jgi:hypothetical protein